MENARLDDLLSLPQVDLNNILSIDNKESREIYELCERDPSSWNTNERETIDRHIAKYSPNQYSEARYDNDYFILTPQRITPFEDKEVPVTVSDIDTCWDKRKFLLPRAPYVIGSISDRKTFDIPGAIRCLHLPVKLPGSEVRVPSEYSQFREALQTILNFEFSVNPSYQDYHAYMTLDQRFVPGGNAQRLPGAHVDGLPRDSGKGAERQRIDHSYIVTNNLATRFFVHPFPMDCYDLNRHNFFAIMRYLADDSRSVLTAPYEINLMNAYSVHTSINAERHFYRTFMRLEFSVLEFDRKGNAVNPHLDYQWHYRSCPIPEHLEFPEELKCRLMA